ncbi:HD-GYP domain-containing protein [Clostridium tagluense]|uniref:HD-GYP domain-containing protein n=1 Tax=Clostridium tagluense TaxID=360422 RepID=UPI001C0B26C0|nr:HD-GYP domain-containing protein [Clostridium tagluense]MBU3128043.1 HD-GYP domain-containing protein [Clostridium tagluense]MCB2311820.1 HD-GYP domain-containing protein [Clostridium tagluense]MCB2316458.1 HD-GYP domain-containing protein [Clostridium tagluense]MCB2321401.1 HD-GYP domain-containing protein [Clostridium tagluense]MCB2326327.1 HD-GYP domain-containing protein [Clostridium tagluense]
MKPKVKSISIYELKPNMILAEDLILNGLNLLTKESALNSSIIKKILDFYPSNTISINDFERAIEEPISQRLIQTEKVLNNFSNRIDNFLNSIDSNPELDLTEIRVMSKEILDDLNDYSSILKSISSSRNIDEYLIRHCVNVAFLSSMLGRWLNLPNRDLTLLTYSAFLHDIGKTKVSPSILNKSSKLTNLEFEQIKKHSVYSYEFVRNIPYLDESVSLGVLMHHERIDGSGYPLHLKEDKISVFAKIIGIADMFDAMTADKVYGKKQNPFVALEIMQHDCMGLFDYNYLTAFITQMSNYYTGEMVKLSDGSIGKVIKIDINNISRPLISIDSNFIDLSIEKNIFITELIT